jgi:serine/threonine protein kinase
MAFPDFDIGYRLGSPSARTPRSTEEELRAAFPEEPRIRFLGAGAFGETWRVGETAVKVIVADAFDETRVAREIAAASVSSPNVVSLKGTTTLFAAGQDRVALIFGYVKGDDLATRIATDGPLDEDDLRELATGLLEGLRAMRSAGVIHRDIKPENVQLRMGSAGRPVILDLGLAYIAEGSTLTVYPAALGTRAYMPPEVLRGERAVHRSDIYAVGVTLYIAATGEHPFLDDGEVIRRSELLPRIEEGIGLELDDEALAGTILAMLHPQAFRRRTAECALQALVS